MGAYLQQILELLTTTPGNLVYHIILTFSVVWALQAGHALYRTGGIQHGRRLAVGLSVLLVLRLALFAAAAAGGQELLEGNLLPPIDRGLTLLSLILIVWLWAFPEPKRLADAATLLLALLALTLLALAVMWWSQAGQEQAYNGSWLDRIGEATTLAVATGGMLLLLLRRPSGWGYGLAMLLTMALGHLAHLFLLSEPGGYSGAVRLAQAAAYPMLLLLPQRRQLPAGDTHFDGTPAAQQRGRYETDPQFVQALLALASEDDPSETCRALTQAVAQAVQADICLLAYPPGENGHIAFPCGLNRFHEVDFGPFSIDSSRVPVIASVLRKGLPVTLHASSTSPDLVSLVQALNLDRAGPLLAVPVSAPRTAPAAGPEDASSAASGVLALAEAEAPPAGEEVEILAALILLSPYSERTWEEDQEAVLQTARSLAHLLQHNRIMETLRTEAEAARESLETAQVELEAARREREKALKELLSLEELYRKEHAQLVSLTAVVRDQEEAGQAAEKNGTQANLELAERDRALAEANQALAEAQAEIERFRSSQEGREKTEPAPVKRRIETGDLEGALRQALEELEQMRIALAEAERHQTLATEQLAAPALDEGRRESLASLALELRGPVAVLFHQALGLLSGPEDELSAAQRRSLEEIKASTQRAAALVDQLIRLTATAEGEDADQNMRAAQPTQRDDPPQAGGQPPSDDPQRSGGSRG